MGNLRVDLSAAGDRRVAVRGLARHKVGPLMLGARLVLGRHGLIPLQPAVEALGEIGEQDADHPHPADAPGLQHPARLLAVAGEVIGGTHHEMHPLLVGQADQLPAVLTADRERLLDQYVQTAFERRHALRIVERRHRADHRRLQAVDRQHFLRGRAGVRHAEVAGDALRRLLVMVLDRHEVGVGVVPQGRHV